MQTIKGIADQLRKATDQIIPSVTSPEKHTAVGACVVALHHADVAIFQKHDHLRARQCLFALQTFRTLAEQVASGRDVDLIRTGYTCAVALKRNGIDETSYMIEMIARLGRQLPEETRKAVDNWVNEHSEKLPGFRPPNDQDGWAMVQLMINGEWYGEAFLTLHERRVAAEALIQYLKKQRDGGNEGGSAPMGKALPNGGSLVVGPNSATVHFGLGGGSVTLVDGKLAYTFPR